MWKSRSRPDTLRDEVDSGELEAAAMRLLARREYARHELLQRLQQKGYQAEQIEPVLAALIERGYLSDARFAESLVRSRRGRGYGPVRIRAELQERRVSDDAALVAAEDWVAQAREVRRKRFGETLPTDPRERQKQIRFLQYRGFSAEQIRAALRHDELE